MPLIFTVALVSFIISGVVLKVKSDSSGLLVLSDTYYPGWECTVNGKSTEIYRANYCMRAVVVPSGFSKIEFIYSPLSATVGQYVSIASCGFLLCFIISGSMRNRKQF